MTPIRVLHLITGLNTGGAELSLARLVTNLDPREFESQVVSMIPLGTVGSKLKEQGVTVESLEMPPGRATLQGAGKLFRILKTFRPDILQTWLYHADLMGLLVGKLARVPAIAWNIRSSDMDFSQYRRLSGLVMKTCARLSAFPDAVVVNSLAGKANHENHGYHPRRWEYIPNGIDTALFFRDQVAGKKVRAEWNVSEAEILIGLVGRLDPQKDHPNFFKAAGIVLKKQPKARFVCVGDGPEEYSARLKTQARELKIDDCLLWAGARKDMTAVYNALDLLVLSSAYGEGFPNVVAEAMACGVPCVTTSVGDAPVLVKDCGVSVPPKSPQVLANAILQQISLTKADLETLQRQSRQIIELNFNMPAVIQKYGSFYQELIR